MIISVKIKKNKMKQLQNNNISIGFWNLMFNLKKLQMKNLNYSPLNINKNKLSNYQVIIKLCFNKFNINYNMIQNHLKNLFFIK